MSILRRIRDISVANLNEMLEQSEDPIRLIDRYLYEQKEQINRSEQLLLQCMNHAQAMGQQYAMSEQLKQKREQQALTALKAGEDEVARLALQEKLLHEEKAEQYRQLYEQSKQSIAELEDQLTQLKADYQEVSAKRSYYQARLQTVKLQQQMNARMSRFQEYSRIPGMFDQLDDRVSQLEMEAKTLRDIRRTGREALVQAGSAVQAALETELNLLRKKIEQEGWAKS